MVKKVNITLDEELLKRLDEYGKQSYLSRSTLISVACNDYLMQREYIGFIKKLSVTLDKAAEVGVLSEDDQKLLDDFQRFATKYQKI